MRTKKHILLLILTGMAGAWWSCSKADDYKKYLQKGTGELVYTGKVDSLKAYPGHNRALLTFVLLSDPTITGVKVYWSNRSDSTMMSIHRSAGVDTIQMYIDSLPEGVVNFEVQTYDGKGNTSVPGDITINVYGDKYASTLLNIPINFSVAIPGDSAMVVWGVYDPTIGLIGTVSKYAGDDGIARDSVVVVSAPGQTTQFLNYPAGGDFQYRTLYLPEPTAIDTFYSPYIPFSIQ